MRKDIPKPVRILIGLVAIAWIVYMWVKKDITATMAAIPAEEAIPLVLTSMAVTLVKVAMLTAAILLIKWLTGKIGGKRR